MNQSSLVTHARAYSMDILTSCEHYPFHNKEHTLSVFDRATYLALMEGITHDDLEDLQIACLFHDTGFTKQYPKNEYIGAQIARSWLEERRHPENRIRQIEEIIMATVLFSKAKNILEGIIQDADLDNIGTKDSFQFSQSLLKELREIAGTEVSDCTYWQFTYRVHTNFQFYTKTAKRERNKQLVRNIRHLASYLEMLECEVPKETGNLEKIV